ncbi:hypothetical protein BCF11_5206 [Collimonas sp. PA-H2]|nr:hypothetical protein BCF11_5206 [Collimonas sp. PA-H2]
MSWDISISKFSKKYTSIADIPDDEKPLDIGFLSVVHEAVLKVSCGFRSSTTTVRRPSC